MSWNQFPPEIRNMILENVASSQTHGGGMAKLARICGEWQDFFEAVIFKQLVLDKSRLTSLEKVISARPSRMTAIEEILYRIRVPEYGLYNFVDAEDEATIERNNQEFSDQMISLLEVLSTWKASTPNGISLRLSATSRTDNNIGPGYGDEEEDYPFQLSGDLKKSPGLAEYHKTLRPPCLERTRWCIKRLRGNPLQLVSATPNHPILPKVLIVKELIIRRQRYRLIGAKSLAHIIRSCLTELRSFRYERRRAHSHGERNELFNLCEDLMSSLPLTLRRFSLTQWIQVGRHLECHPSEPLTEAICNAEMFKHLNEFAASAVLCGDTILRCLSKPVICENLELLSLAPRTFKFSDLRHGIMETVRESSKLISTLPKLRVMELWGYMIDEPDGFIFRYSLETTSRQPSITWICYSKEPVLLDNLTRACWVDATANLGAPPLEIITKQLDQLPEFIEEHKADYMVGQLELRRLLHTPITLAQMEASRIYREWQISKWESEEAWRNRDVDKSKNSVGRALA